MALIRIHAWWLAVWQDDIDRVYQAFRDVLSDLPMSHADLAEQLGVSQPTISRWASGKISPALEDMLATVEAIQARLTELQNRAQHAREVLAAVQTADAEFDRYERNRTERNLKRQTTAKKRLHELLVK